VSLKKRNPGGRPPSKVRTLSKLLSMNPFISNKELAVALGVKDEDVVAVYKNRLKRSFVKLNKTICPKCESSSIFLDRVNGERVCRVCGLVIRRDNFVTTLPMDETYAFVNNLAFGRSLGGTLPTKQIYQVIATAPAEKLDLPIRATQIQIISNATESPIVRAMLSYSSEMLHALGLDNDSEQCHVLSNIFGLRVRSIGAFLQAAKNPRIKPQLTARAAMYLTLGRFEKNSEARRLRKQFPFDKLHLDFVVRLDRLMKTFGISRKETAIATASAS
jgi:hypothetical protein